MTYTTARQAWHAVWKAIRHLRPRLAIKSGRAESPKPVEYFPLLIKSAGERVGARIMGSRKHWETANNAVVGACQ